MFFRIAMGLFALLVVFGAAGMWVLLGESTRTMSGAGIPGVPMGIFLLGVAELLFCAAGVCTALSLARREPHRRLSVAILIVWALILSMLLLAFWAHASGCPATSLRAPVSSNSRWDVLKSRRCVRELVQPAPSLPGR